MPRLHIDGNVLEYRALGSGEPLVLVHGSASDYRTWRLQHEAFSGRFRTITYSRRYHWPNPQIPKGADYSMLQHVDDLGALIHGLEASPAHLVGHSYGAFLCLLLALRAPQHVRSLVLAEPPVITLFASSRPKPFELLKLLAIRPRTGAAIIKFGAAGILPARRAFRRADTESGLRKFGDAVFGPGGYDRLPSDRKARLRDNLTNVKAEILGSGFAPLDPKQVRDLEVPVLLIVAECSIGLFHHLTARLAELLPHARQTVIDGANHMMHEDNAPAFNRAVQSFLIEIAAA